jgi:hypothetical protein
VIEVAVSFDAMESGALYVDISYQVRGLNDPRNLVFPFYVIPHEEEPDGAALSATALPATPFFAQPDRLVLNGGTS